MGWAFSDSRLAVALRRLRGRYGLATRRLAIRTHVPWYLRALVILALLAASLAVATWAYEAGRRYVGSAPAAPKQDELHALREKLAALEQELTALRATSHSSESALRIERAAQEQLTRQIKVLEQENGRLKEDLGWFENLAGGGTGEPRLSINRFQVEPDSIPGQLRYRMLVAFQGGKRDQDREFRGSLQFVLSLQQPAGNAKLVLPAAGEPNRQRFGLSFRHFQRVEGTLQVPSQAKVVSVEVRLVQDGATKTSRTVTL